jgi:glycosyltransferase involved in cell wall biosynthesis
MSHLVSILIPAYNKASWIRETMLSAINQTWPNKEIIVIDDGSSDNTFKIAKTLESKIVKVVTQPNAGVCGARNNALKLAQGDYIQWLDADDVLDPEKISLQLRHDNEGPDSRLVLTCAWATFFYSIQRAKFIPDSLWQDLTPADWIFKKFTDNVWMNPTVWLVSRRLTELAGPWDARLNLCGNDDGEYICRVVAASEGVKFVPDARCYYRVGNPGSLAWNMGKSYERLEALVLSLSLSIKHLRSIEDSERTRRAGLKHLEAWLFLFYPEEHELFLRINELASELGGSLSPPRASWKYYPIEQLFGFQKAKVVQANWVKLKLLLSGKLDKLLC